MYAKCILVYGDWEGIAGPVPLGSLYVESVRGREVFFFEYESSWLKSGYVQDLDPELNFYSGLQYLQDDKPNFGLFLDSSPDRWGRVLMRRREAVMARAEERKVRKLMESDYLLGVYDESRMGGLRFKLEEDGNFLSDNREMAAPPWAKLRDLEFASLQLEKDDSVDDPEYVKWLNLLLAPGSSLGGARPKASVLGTDGQLWIAKFPSRHDEMDTGGWEKVVHELAVESGLQLAPAEAQKFSHRHHTFLTRRFDRRGSTRLHYASAMTLLGYSDGADYSEGASYLDLVEFLMRYGHSIKEDLKELWSRIVFSICVSNTDDHLRNHGFMLAGKGWKLSPAFDINPIPTGTGLKLNISEYDNALELDLAMEVHRYFRLSEKEALSILKHIKGVVSNWRKVASRLGISRSEQVLMEPAFLAAE